MNDHFALQMLFLFNSGNIQKPVIHARNTNNHNVVVLKAKRWIGFVKQQLQ
jgi:hypothetical protein